MGFKIKKKRQVQPGGLEVALLARDQVWTAFKRFVDGHLANKDGMVNLARARASIVEWARTVSAVANAIGAEYAPKTFSVTNSEPSDEKADASGSPAADPDDSPTQLTLPFSETKDGSEGQ